MKKITIITVLVLCVTFILCGCSYNFSDSSKNYFKMSAEELACLSDEELYDAIIARIEKRVDSQVELEMGVKSLNSSQRLVFSLDWFIIEVENGGLCQFFVNSSRMIAPFVSDYMESVGAKEHKKLFDEFIGKNNINLYDLTFFDVNREEEYAEKAEKYPFDDFDNAFYELEPLKTYLIKFIRENIEDF